MCVRVAGECGSGSLVDVDALLECVWARTPVVGTRFAFVVFEWLLSGMLTVCTCLCTALFSRRCYRAVTGAAGDANSLRAALWSFATLTLSVFSRILAHYSNFHLVRHVAWRVARGGSF